MADVRCICQTTQQPNVHLVVGSVGTLTDTSDMGHWTSQHLTSGSSIHHENY